ncbi:DUF748 domain-containing protein [Alteromonas sp. 1_MG-2023]|uniref:DUF748 domain-containing protein n=1 Tax=Alteromonas sp. 1_MG-2023 TaxID=3062669 RepID=UPI0026E34864|nr:DUF748 domain-containing protein [Alteromonas sp. 1_MG-2023]MDO6566859.1 DUF748 domain-containing protein [Alteromonas sp. 1_MG-2023]
MKTANRYLLTSLAILLGLLIIVRISMPYAAQWYINKTLSQPGEYSGRVGDVDIMLWRGAYSLEHVLLYKSNGQVDKPLFRADEVEFTLNWSQLIKGAASGTVNLTRPEINFVDGATSDTSQAGKNENWLNIANQLFPLSIDKLSVTDGKIGFYNPETSPVIDISLHDIQGEVTNLVNSDALSDNRVANANVSAQTAQQGTLKLKAKLNPATQKPTFDLNLQADNIALVNFKNFLDTYAPFDLEAGTLTLAAELAADDGKVKGYIKPILHKVEVFSWKGDIERDGDGLIEGTVEALSAFVAEIFENQSEDQIATRIPIEGDLSSPETDVFSAIGAIIKNAFIQAINGDIEQSVELQTLSEPALSKPEQADDADKESP